jgi:hypothetical protein
MHLELMVFAALKKLLAVMKISITSTKQFQRTIKQMVMLT